MTDKINPGEGYRLLKSGETLRPGDEFAVDYDWYETDYPGSRFGVDIGCKDGIYRRRIAPGEVQCRYCGDWVQAVSGCRKCENQNSARAVIRQAELQPLFEKRALASIKRVTATFGQRGNEYGDTMRDCQWLALRAAAKELGIDIPIEKARAIAIAGMVDIKYQRLQGGYKDDSIIDGIAYASFFADEMMELAGGAK